MNLANLLLGIVIGIILWRWWRKHRVQIRRWWQKQEESAPRQWHPKSEKACPGCQNGLHVTVARVNQAVEPYRSEKRVSQDSFQRKATLVPVENARISVLLARWCMPWLAMEKLAKVKTSSAGVVRRAERPSVVGVAQCYII